MRRDKKDEFYWARTKFKNATAIDLGYFNKSVRIYISNSLTAENWKLFNEVLGVKKELDSKYIWTLNGQIYLRESMETAILKLAAWKIWTLSLGRKVSHKVSVKKN